MSVVSFPGKPTIPDTVKHIDADVVSDVLSRHLMSVTEAALELGVASADLRKLLWARPYLVGAAAEIEERRLDLAEKAIYEALTSDDPRRKDAAAMFTIRNSAKARRRGWITSASAGVDLTVNAGNQPVNFTFSWARTPKVEGDDSPALIEHDDPPSPPDEE